MDSVFREERFGKGQGQRIEIDVSSLIMDSYEMIVIIIKKINFLKCLYPHQI